MELTILATHQRFGDSILVVYEVVGEPAFNAKFPSLSVSPGCGLVILTMSIIVDVQIQLTSNAAKIAGCSSRARFLGHQPGSGAFFSINAPVGQVSMQPPHNSQVVSSKPRSPAVEIVVSLPRNAPA